MVITVPPIEKSRYFAVQVIDLYSFNFDYTEFALAGFRTQLFNPGDLDNVKKVQTRLGAHVTGVFQQFRRRWRAASIRVGHQRRRVPGHHPLLQGKRRNARPDPRFVPPEAAAGRAVRASVELQEDGDAGG
jgi:hypothetical protein